MAMKHAWRGLAAMLALGLGALGLMPAGAAQAASGSTPPPAASGKAAPLPGSRPHGRNLPLLGGPDQKTSPPDVVAAAARARKTGKPAAIPDMTTPTVSATVSPAGVVTATSFALPVRVRHGSRWVPVSTRLRVSGGRLVPAALPGDAVSFSDGGTGPMAVISAGGSQVSLSWPGTLPVPSVSGASATYASVLPGVSLVLTATSAATGGFREVLVIRNAAAAARLSGLRLRESGAPLRPALAGGLAAPFDGGREAFVSPAPMMWDSSAQRPGTAAARSAAAAAKAVGAGLAEPGLAAASSAAAPAGGARLARLAAGLSAGGREISVAPDTRMLAAKTTRFPVFLDPDFAVQGNEIGYDPVQSEPGCTGSHFNSSAYPQSPVGFDNFGQGSCQTNDTDYALYQVAIPRQGSGSGAGTSVLAGTANLLSASFQVTEAYTSSCSADPTVTVSWVGGIGPNTGWPGPGLESGETDASTPMGPDSGSCNTVEDTSNRVSAGFNELTNLNKAPNTAGEITFRVWEKNDTSEDDHKQLTDNPDLQVTYIDTPNVPSDLEVTPSGSGSGSVLCDTTNPGTNGSAQGLPRIGATDSNHGVTVFGAFTTDDTNSVTGTVRYWNNATPTATTTVQTATGTGRLSAAIPSSFTSGMANGTVVGYQAEDSDSFNGTTYASGFSQPCYFAVYPTSPDKPAVTTDFDQETPQPVGTALHFTVTQSPGDTASTFVWDLDQQPPTTGTPPADETCTTAQGATCQIVNGTATITVTVPAPGPHILWLYETDAAGNQSGTNNAGVSTTSPTFIGEQDPSASYTAGASLAANFAAALGAGQSFDNTMISTEAGQSGTADGDGGGRSFDEAALAADQWSPGGTVTVDGASFTLPSFGTSASTPDNLLAANQVIGTGTAGAQGSAVVFLATSTNANVQVPGTVTGSTDAGSLSQDLTVPGVAGGTAVTGTACTPTVVFDENISGCQPAQGSISYASGCPDPAKAFDLAVPNWSGGPADIAALTTTVYDTGGSQQNAPVSIYAFAVPVNPACTISSVTLPDVGSEVQETGNTSGLGMPVAALHIFGVAVRDTTTATPEAAGSAVAAPSGQAWTAAAESPIEDGFASLSGIQTIRVAMPVNISAPAGAQVRVRLSNPGFLSGTVGNSPLSVGDATIAVSSSGPTAAQTPVRLTFSGATTVVVPDGGDIYSDPLTLPFAVTAGQQLLVSLYLPSPNIVFVPANSQASGAVTWITPPGTPGGPTFARSSASPSLIPPQGGQTDFTGSTSGSPFTSSANESILVSGVDVTTPQNSFALPSGVTVPSPGAPTVVVAGDNVAGGTGSEPVPDTTANAPSHRLAGQLMSQGLATGFGPVDAGIESNQVLTDGPGTGGVSLIARLDRDVLAEPDVGTVILDEGLSDLLGSSGTTSTQLTNALQAVIAQLGAFGVAVLPMTLTPCSGSGGLACSTAADNNRQAVNATLFALSRSACFPEGVDAAATVGTGTPQVLQTSPTDYDAGDHVNLSVAGYAAMARAIGSAGCQLSPAIYP